ncbi:outer membrane protein transport protein [Marinobacter sp. M216]|uniref:Outer membrane protein transport protein n=2 Tax=Marinobacteraceae TaxID=2887365 RepID=A0ABT7HET6_9GAMM|nr:MULTISPECIES: outer membrane protein transport protein [unclassified Marinobacter]MBW7472288.1 outer membrane protein transport protein [Marinobacter sp. F4218]MDK9558858.1 outer membrane protein transport protein [Marinobacter sp. M216]
MRSTLLARAVRLTTLAAITGPATALAGGFSLNEQSASAMGTANAGAAANPENATTVLFNPAGMSQLSGTNVSFGAAVLDIDAEAKQDSISATRENPAVPVRPATNGGDISDPAVLPNFYLSHEVSDEIDVGFGIHAPYGLAADYDDDFAGRFFADKTELTAIAFTPSVSVSNGQGLSMGAGLNLIYAEGRLTRYQDLSSTAGPAALALPEPYADIEGDDVAVTFRVGFLYELSNRTQFGLTAQTGTELELKGDAEISNVPVPPTFTDTTTLNEKVTVPLAIPESVTFGARHQLTDEVTVLAGATYARWGRFEELDIISRDPNGEIAGVPGAYITHITEKWKNTWQFNLGGIWQATPAWAFKAGYAWDESPVDQFVTARIPSEDRHWLTLGAQWKDVQSGWAVDAAIGTLIFADDAEVDDRYYTHQNPTRPSSVANYQGAYELSAWSASVQVSKAF